MARMIGLRRTMLSCFGLLLAALLRGAPVHWFPVGPPGNPAITAMAVAKADYVVPFPPRPSLLYAGTAGARVFRSFDAGLTWASTGAGLGGDPTALAVRQILHFGVDSGSYDTTVFAGTSSGIYRLTPGAAAWAPCNTGLASLDIRALAVSKDGVVFGAAAVTVFAGTAGGLFASADGGDTWVQKTVGLPAGSDAGITALASDPSVPSTLYAGAGVGLFKSTDGGETWSKLDTGSLFRISVSTIAVDPLAPSRLFIAGINTPPCFPLCLAPSFPTSLRSLDGGASWTTMNGLAGNVVRAFAATPNLPSRVFAGTAGNGVYESADAGLTWTVENDGLGLASVSSLVIDPVLPSFAFAGTSQGVFCAPLGQVAVTCFSDGQTLCLNAGRFRASVVWRSSNPSTGTGQAVAITDNTGAFWFFDPTNLELVVKVLDGRSVNAKFWVFYGALSNVEYTITVTDTLTGAVRTYFNPQGLLASVADTAAF
jgi:photosystem II stability/assembly factor-like uncharacterized protein